MKENICMKTLRTKNGGTYNDMKHMNESEKENCFKTIKKVLHTWFAFKVFKKFPRLFTIPCQWAIKARCASVVATEREDPLTKLALDVLGAFSYYKNKT